MEMTQIDLNHWSAEKVMGWEIYDHIKTYRVYGDKVQVIPTYSNGENFDILVENWHPLTNWNQLKLVIEKMRELGWYINIEGYRKEDGYVVNFNTKDIYPGPQSSHKDLPTAVLMAAREAIEPESPEAH